MSRLIIALSCVLVLGVLSVVSIDVEATLNGLELVGTVGKKSFYRDAANACVDYMRYMEFCHKNGMETASILSANEQAVIEAYYRRTNYAWSLWLGAWDINHEGKWTWVDTGSRVKKYSNWADQGPVSGRNYNCGIIRYTSYQWVDTPCTSLFVPLCQSSATNRI